ncbi:MAG: hypothetical protein WBD07_17590 [Vicinamibacterales bacterium]
MRTRAVAFRAGASAAPLSSLLLVLLAMLIGGPPRRELAAQAGRAPRITLPPNQLLRPTGDRNSLAIAPDGSRFVYVANNRLYVKPVRQGEATEIAGIAERQGLSNPLFTPDGQAIVFWSAEDGGALKRIAVGGGTPVRICAADNPYGLAWGTGGTLLVGQGAKGIFKVPVSGGTPEPVVRMNAGELAYGPQLLPGGDTILYTLIDVKTANTDGWDRARIVTQPLSGGERTIVIDQGRDARYMTNGYLLYALDNRLLAVKFDPTSRAATGRPITVADDVHMAATVGTAHFTVSDSGTLLYWPEKSGETQFGLVSLDSGAKNILGPAVNFANAPRVSPDGRRVAMSGVGDGNLWIADLDTPLGLRKLLSGSYYNFPVFSEDGTRIILGTNLPDGVETVFSMRADGSGGLELLARPARAPEGWKPGTQTFSYITRRGVMDYDLWTFDVATQTFAPLVNIPVSAQLSSRFSPDGRWVAYMSNETGNFEVWVEPWPATTARYRVSQQGGRGPIWSLDGSELYYDSNGKMYAVKVQTGTPMFGEQRELPISGFIPTGLRRTFDLMPDGKQLVMLFRGPSTVGMIANWTTLVPGR